MQIEGLEGIPLKGAMLLTTEKQILLSANPTLWGHELATLRMTKSLGTQRNLGTRVIHPVRERSGCCWESHFI